MESVSAFATNNPSIVAPELFVATTDPPVLSVVDSPVALVSDVMTMFIISLTDSELFVFKLVLSVASALRFAFPSMSPEFSNVTSSFAKALILPSITPSSAFVNTVDPPVSKSMNSDELLVTSVVTIVIASTVVESALVNLSVLSNPLALAVIDPEISPAFSTVTPVRPNT